MEILGGLIIVAITIGLFMLLAKVIDWICQAEEYLHEKMESCGPNDAVTSLVVAIIWLPFAIFRLLFNLLAIICAISLIKGFFDNSKK